MHEVLDQAVEGEVQLGPEPYFGHGWIPYKWGIAVDTETTGLSVERGHRPFLTILYPDMGEPVLVWSDDPYAREKIAGVITDPKCVKCYWNMPFDWRMHRAQFGIIPVWPWFDGHSVIAILDENASPFKLKPCAAAYLKENVGSADAIAMWLASNRARFIRDYGREPNYSDVPRDMMSVYCTDDGKYTIKFGYLLMGGLRKLGMERNLDDEMKLLPALIDMQDEGAEVDVEYLKTEQAKALGMAQYQFQKIAEETGVVNLNLRSNQQVAQLMYGTLGIQCVDFTEGGAPSTSKTALKRHARTNTTVARIKRIRQLLFFAGQCDTIMEAVCPDGKLHPSQNPAGAVTGRMSCSGPNLHGIPREGTIKGFSIRKAFRPSRRQFHHDYKQIEVVDFADYSQDPVMCGAIRNKQDVHRAVAARVKKVLGHGDAPVTDEERQLLGKTPGFAIIYGAGNKKLMETINLDDAIERLVTLGEAASIKGAYLEAFPGVSMLKEKVAFEISTKGMIVDRFGRAHRLSSSDWYKGINWVIQGGCSTLLKRAIVRMSAVAKWWRERGVDDRLILTVHDEFVHTMPHGISEDTVREVCATQACALLSDRDLFDVPVRQDLEECSPTWGEMKSYELPEELPWTHPAVLAAHPTVLPVTGVRKWWKSAPTWTS